MASVRVRYTLTEASLLAGLRAGNDFPKLGVQLGLIFFGIMTALDAVLMWDWTSVEQVSSRLERSATMAVGFAVLMTAATALVRQPRSARKHFRDNPQDFGEVELEADDLGVNLRGQWEVAAHAWDDLHGFKETRKVFLVATSKTTGFIIPKAGLEPATETALRGALQARLRRLRGLKPSRRAR